MHAESGQSLIFTAFLLSQKLFGEKNVILNMMFLIRQELQKIVKDLFLLINETNADKASQEVLVKTGMKMYSLSTFSSKSSNCSDLQNAKYFLLFSVS